MLSCAHCSPSVSEVWGLTGSSHDYLAATSPIKKTSFIDQLEIQGTENVISRELFVLGGMFDSKLYHLNLCLIKDYVDFYI